MGARVDMNYVGAHTHTPSKRLAEANDRPMAGYVLGRMRVRPYDVGVNIIS